MTDIPHLRDYAGWLIVKHGMFYRPKWSGYTSNAAEAGRYTRAQAEAEIAIEPASFYAILAPECSQQSYETLSATRPIIGVELERIPA